jgi:hypothetical protein
MQQPRIWPPLAPDAIEESAYASVARQTSRGATILFANSSPGKCSDGLGERPRSHQDNPRATSVQIGQRDGLRVPIDIDGHFTLSGFHLHVSYAAAEPTSRTQTWMS